MITKVDEIDDQKLDLRQPILTKLTHKNTNMADKLGIPVRLLHESLGHVVTVEVKGGATYRGQLYEGEHEKK